MARSKDKRTMLEKEIDRLLVEMSEMEDQTDENYLLKLGTLEKLVNLDLKKKSSSDKGKRLDPNTVLSAAVHIGEVVLILGHEQLFQKIITTKAFGRMIKLRL